jgi:hypothetical protein
MARPRWNWVVRRNRVAIEEFRSQAEAVEYVREERAKWERAPFGVEPGWSVEWEARDVKVRIPNMLPKRARKPKSTSWARVLRPAY